MTVTHETRDIACPEEIAPVDRANTSAPASNEPAREVENQNDLLEGRVIQVDQPHESGPVDVLAGLAARRQERSPLVPVWLRSRTDALQVLAWQAEHTGYVLAYHTLRLPKYVAKLLARTPVGTWRVLVELISWLFDLEGRPVRRAAVSKEESAEYLALSRQRDNRVRSACSSPRRA
ncbi:hypothetical protein ACIBF7_43915 [Nonomuraea sp. NPDC050478]|uniref:hypothetical protein n=1 Tax=Nonomuraea sp. NPDC050478 TaxID=3364365 RepID=UPI00379348AF